MIYQITRYPKLYDSAAFERAEIPWPPPWTHLELVHKEDGPLFGPYALRPGATKRSNDAFAHMTLAVFDVDTGTQAQVDASIAAVRAAGLASFWYTSHSFEPAGAVAKWRAVFPLASPVSALGWPTVRADLIKRFNLLVEVDKCTGVSHAYFLPACPPGAERRTVLTDGVPYAPSWLAVVADVPRAMAPLPADAELFPAEPPPETAEARARKRLAVRAKRYAEDAPAKQSMLERLLRGESIVDGTVVKSESGDPPMAVLCAVLVTALHPMQWSVYEALLRPTVELMQREGYKLPWRKVRAMVTSATRKHVQREADEAGEMQRLITALGFDRTTRG